MKSEVITAIVCATFLIGGTIAGLLFYNINDRNNMAKNLETAMSKGIDPLSVKCAYDGYSTVCAVYAAGKK